MLYIKLIFLQFSSINLSTFKDLAVAVNIILDTGDDPEKTTVE